MNKLEKAFVHTLPCGDVVVDYGPVWYRVVKKSGKIIKRTARAKSVSSREANAKEAKEIMSLMPRLGRKP